MIHYLPWVFSQHPGPAHLHFDAAFYQLLTEDQDLLKTKPHLLSIICSVLVLWNQEFLFGYLWLPKCQNETNNNNGASVSTGAHHKTCQGLQAPRVLSRRFKK